MEGGRGEEKEGDGEGKKGMDGDVEAPSGGFIVVCVCFSRSSSRERQARLFWCGQSRREAEGQFRLPTDLPFRRPPFPYLLTLRRHPPILLGPARYRRVFIPSDTRLVL